MSKKAKIIILVSFVVVGLIAVYAIINPTTSAFVPKCMIKTMIGYDCPTCGGQRFFHAILNGNFYDALILNPFLFLALPYIFIVAYTTFSKSKLSLKIKPIVQNYITVIIYIIIYIGWGIIRNTPLWVW